MRQAGLGMYFTFKSRRRNEASPGKPRKVAQCRQQRADRQDLIHESFRISGKKPSKQ